MTLHIGFTGTRTGCTPQQHDALKLVLWHLYADSGSSFHHGDCVGCDAQAHKIAYEIGYDIVLHPPNRRQHRAFCEGAFARYPEKDYLVRNCDIVDLCSTLVAVTKGFKEEIRSGTWSTIRYARTLKREICIIQPNGNKWWQKL